MGKTCFGFTMGHMESCAMLVKEGLFVRLKESWSQALSGHAFFCAKYWLQGLPEVEACMIDQKWLWVAPGDP